MINHLVYFVVTDKDGKPYKEKEEFIRVLFLMHQWFIESDQIAQLFLRQYPYVFSL